LLELDPVEQVDDLGQGPLGVKPWGARSAGGSAPRTNDWGVKGSDRRAARAVDVQVHLATPLLRSPPPISRPVQSGMQPIVNYLSTLERRLHSARPRGRTRTSAFSVISPARTIRRDGCRLGAEPSAAGARAKSGRWRRRLGRRSCVVEPGAARPRRPPRLYGLGRRPIAGSLWPVRGEGRRERRRSPENRPDRHGDQHGRTVHRAASWERRLGGPQLPQGQAGIDARRNQPGDASRPMRLQREGRQRGAAWPPPDGRADAIPSWMRLASVVPTAWRAALRLPVADHLELSFGCVSDRELWRRTACDTIPDYTQP
jgi:hypothetical protein